MRVAVTAVLLVAAAGLAGLFGWLGARPPNPLKGPRLAPYRLLMMLSAAAALLLGILLLGALRGGS
jgi:hypothetical protein